MPNPPEIRRGLTTDDTAHLGDRFTVAGDPKKLVFDAVPAIDCCAGCDALINPDVVCLHMPDCYGVIFKVVGSEKPKAVTVHKSSSVGCSTYLDGSVTGAPQPEASSNSEVISAMTPMKEELPVRQDLTIMDNVEAGEVFTTANDPFNRKFMVFLDGDKGCNGCDIPFVIGMECSYTPACKGFIFKLYDPGVICRPVRLESGRVLVGANNETICEIWSATPEELDEIVRLINRP